MGQQRPGWELGHLGQFGDLGQQRKRDAVSCRGKEAMSTLGNAGTTNSGSRTAPVFVGFTGICASAILIHGLFTIHGWHSWEFLSLLLVAALTSRLKIKLPGLNGNMSVSLPFILIAMTQLSLPEALAVAASSIFVQSVPRGPHKFR